MLQSLVSKTEICYEVVAIDPLDSRRLKMKNIYAALGHCDRGLGNFTVASIEDGKKTILESTNGALCNAVLEVGFGSPIHF